MLHEEDQRKAYLQLMTSFIMKESRQAMKQDKPVKEKTLNERVKYMISQGASSRIELSSAGVQLYTMLKVGMTLKDVLALGDRVCLERGYVLISDTCKRLYMHLEKNAQIWVELTQEGIDGEPVVTSKSDIERKAPWKVYRNNILKVHNNQ